MRNPFSSSLQTCGVAGHGIRDTANTEIYGTLQQFSEISTKFQRGLYEISRELQIPGVVCMMPPPPPLKGRKLLPQ